MPVRVTNGLTHSNKRGAIEYYKQNARARETLKIGAYNTRGLSNFLQYVNEIADKLDILFLSETWMRTCDYDLTEMVDELVYSPFQNANNKGFGRIAVVLSTELKYEVVSQSSTKLIQSLTMRSRG